MRFLPLAAVLIATASQAMAQGQGMAAPQKGLPPVPATPAASVACDCVLVPRVVEQTEIAYLQSLGTLYGPQNVSSLAATALACYNDNPDKDGKPQMQMQMPDGCPVVRIELGKRASDEAELARLRGTPAK